MLSPAWFLFSPFWSPVLLGFAVLSLSGMAGFSCGNKNYSQAAIAYALMVFLVWLGIRRNPAMRPTGPITRTPGVDG